MKKFNCVFEEKRLCSVVIEAETEAEAENLILETSNWDYDSIEAEITPIKTTELQTISNEQIFKWIK